MADHVKSLPRDGPPVKEPDGEEQGANARKRKRAAKALEREQRRERQREQWRMADVARAKLRSEYGGPIPMITREEAAEAAKTFGPGDWSEAGIQRLTEAAMVLWGKVATHPQPLDFRKLRNTMTSDGVFDDNYNLVDVRPLSGEDADSGWNDLELLWRLRDRFMEETPVESGYGTGNRLYVYNNTGKYMF